MWVWYPQRLLDSLELELQMFASYQHGAYNQTRSPGSAASTLSYSSGFSLFSEPGSLAKPGIHHFNKTGWPWTNLELTNSARLVGPGTRDRLYFPSTKSQECAVRSDFSHGFWGSKLRSLCLCVALDWLSCCLRPGCSRLMGSGKLQKRVWD